LNGVNNLSLVDKRSIFLVIGCLLQKPNLLNNTTKYNLTKEDFPEKFHKIIFASIYNLWNEGITSIDYVMIDNYLSKYNLQYQVFVENNGIEYLQAAKDSADITNFNYVYDRVKKFSLLRSYQESGINIDHIYSEKEVDLRRQELMQERFDSLSLTQITEEIDKKIVDIKGKFLLHHGTAGQHAAEGIVELKEELKENPEIGLPLRGGIMNMITRGARLKKLYMRSAPTSVGKTRLALGDACNLGTNEIYSTELNRWVKNGIASPTLFITTELEMDEVQTPLLAFLSGVNETKILDGEYSGDEEARVDYAIKVLQKGQLWIEYLPNFSYQDIENTVKRYFLNNKIRYFFFDYLHTTMKMLAEVGKEAGGIRLREDNILHMFSTNLKELCNELGIFMYTSTQVSGDWESRKTANQNILRGAKAIADKLDVGMIALKPTKEDLDALKPILEKGFELVEQPNLVFHIYKLRRSPYQGVKVWSYVDLGTCRLKNLFVTKNDYTLIPVQSLNIEVTE